MTVADIAEVCVMAINRVVNRSRGCCIKQIKLFREDIAVRFFIISDLHLGEETDMQQLYTRTRTLCRKIRESTTPGEQIPIILLGDIVDGGNPDAFCAAKKLLTKIEQELKDYSTTFDFVPGNHDLHGTDLAAFDKFISKYGVPKFSENRAYNRQYGGVNFIFADSNLSRDHRACGEIDVAAIIELVKGGMTNVLLCHHSFTQEYGDTHDVINGGERFLEILAGHEIKFLIHGHTHRAAIDVHPYTVKEIGCGSFSKDSKKMGNIYKQFTVGCIREGTIVSIERWIDTDDGGEPFAYTQLFPKERQFKDPDSVGKQIYDDVPDYISRRVVVHNAEAVDLNSLTAIADVVKKRGSNVLVMGDAGHGKSVEMQHLAAELGRTAKFPFLYSLKQYCGQAIEDLCPEEYRDLLPSRQVLIFDGYDELGTYIDVFDRNLRAFCKDFPSVCIVISARGNFCQHKISQENVFANFTVCSLEELNERDIVQYISAHRIDSQALVVEAKEKGLADLLRNPFYLTRVVNLYLKYKQLPPRTELMDSLIEECMERDEGKFSEDLEENRKNSLQLLGKAATAMLLLQKQKLENTKEYQELFQLEERNLMNFSGLFRRENNSWSFTHNNFKEYLAARYISQLSKEDALALISDGYGIMPTWLNAVGFLLGMNTDWDVQQWLLEHEPEAIVKYRPESMDSTARSCLFREIFEHYEGKRLWIDQTIISYKDLAEFSSSEESMRYLLDKIENPACFISQVSAICLVQYFSNLYTATQQPLYSTLPDADDVVAIKGYSNTRMAVRPNQRIIMLNKGIGDKGFTICCDCGAAMPGDDPSVLKDIMRPYRSKFLRTRCKHNETKNVNLGYDFITDMLVLEIALDRQQVSMDLAKNSWLNRAGQSLAEALRLSACQELDIEFTELVTGFRVRQNQKGDFIDIYLYDSLSSGAGYAVSIEASIQQLLIKTRELLSSCNCDSACHKCLKHYRNQYVHGLLDRSAALDLLTWAEKGVRSPMLPVYEQRNLLQSVEQILQFSGVHIDFDHEPIEAESFHGKKRIVVYPAMWARPTEKNMGFVSDSYLKYAKPYALKTIVDGL